ncbi:MAG: sodium:alanine symporter family protein, partial [Brevibacterium aurantiacum]
PLVFNLLKNYQQQRRQGLEPVFHRSDLPTFKRINTDIDAWDGTDEVTTAKFWQDRGKKVRPDDD